MRTGRTEHHRRGTALVEFAMCIPLLALVISLTFFFGHAMMNQQHVRISDRYTAWRRAAGGNVDGQTLNTLFFRERAEGIGLTEDGGPADTLEDYVAFAAWTGSDAERLARATVLQRFPRGQRATVEAEFPSSSGAGVYRRLAGAIRGSHYRDGVEWRRGQARPEDGLRDEFLGDVDATLDNLPAPADTLGQVLRGLYLAGW